MAAIAAACRDWGFFQITGHGVPAEDIREVIGTARAYFAQPREEKRRNLRSRDNPWGFYDRELTKERRDRKEVFDIGPDAGGMAAVEGDPFEGQTPWPEAPREFAPVMCDWFVRMAGLADRLVGLIGEGLGDSAGEMASAMSPVHTSYLRLNYYPLGDPLAAETGSEADLGIHHHTDAGALTVLLQDGTSGLQVYHQGQWHDVDPLPDAFTINIGDMVQLWSNDLYRAPPHRVLAMDRADRISIPFFHNPAYSADIRPLSRTAALPSAQLGRVPPPPCRRRFRRLRHRGADQRVAHRRQRDPGVRFPDKADVSMAANHVMMRA